jgi:hypothetical protein
MGRCVTPFWQVIEASLAKRWALQVKAGKKIEDLDLFGPVYVVPVAASPMPGVLV